MLSEKDIRIIDIFLLTDMSYGYAEELYGNETIRTSLEKLVCLYTEVCSCGAELGKMKELQQMIEDELGKNCILARQIKSLITCMQKERIINSNSFTTYMAKITGAIDPDRKKT